MPRDPRLHKMAFPTPVVWPLDESQGSSPLQGHGSWLECEVALSMTRLGNTQKSCILEVSSSHWYEKWCEVVVLLRGYENICNTGFKNIYNKFKQRRWYEVITHDSKQISMFLRTLEIGVQRFLVLPTQVSDCHLI